MKNIPSHHSRSSKKHAPVTGRYIMGKNCIEEVIKSNPKRIIQMYALRSDPVLEKKAEMFGFPLKIVSKQELFHMVNSESHQSLVALVKEINQPSLKEYLEKSAGKDKDLVLVLDSINDPQNFGSLLRSAECFGVGAVVWSKNRGTDLTPTASKTGVGASELITMIKVSNLVEAVKKCYEEGYEIITAEVGKNASDLDSFVFADKTVLIVGSEGDGVRSLLAKQAERCVYIPMSGAIDSLNVSQATAVILYRWKMK